MGHSTHIRIGGVRIRLNAGGTLRDPAEGLEYIARCNLRALQADPKLREEALRRVLSPPCSARGYVQRASFYQSKGDDERALATYRRAVQLDRASAEAQLGIALNSGIGVEDLWAVAKDVAALAFAHRGCGLCFDI